MLNLKPFLFVAIGSAAGGMLRYAGSLLIRQQNFPSATLLINVIGSFTIGLIFGAAQKSEWLGSALWLLLATGLCGGFTTFSAFSIENIRLIQGGQIGTAFLYICASLIAGLGFCYLGLRITQ